MKSRKKEKVPKDKMSNKDKKDKMVTQQKVKIKLKKPFNINIEAPGKTKVKA